MSSLPMSGPLPAAPARPRRVRHQARESLAVMALSVGLSAGFATVLLVVTSLGR
jgi:hypothetical protein